MGVVDEITELHRFFEQWLGGDEADFARFEASLAPDFTYVGPGGELKHRAELVEWLRASKGHRGGLEIRVRDIRPRPLGHGLHLVLYEEWQDKKGRLSTALLRERADAPQGVEWVHVHETWFASEA